MGILGEKFDHIPRFSGSTPASITRQVCPQLQGRHCQKIGGHHSPTVTFVQMPWAALEEACLLIRGCLFQPLADTIPLLVPTFKTGFGGSSLSSRIPKLRKLCSTSSTRRSREDTFLCRSQSTSPGIYSALCRPDRRVDRHVRCTRPERCRSRFGLSLAPTQQVSNQRLLTWGLPLGPPIGMVRSIASSLISSARNLFQPSGSSFFRSG